MAAPYRSSPGLLSDTLAIRSQFGRGSFRGQRLGLLLVLEADKCDWLLKLCHSVYMFDPAVWGTVSSWVSAGGGLLAVVFAGLAARTALRSYRNQSTQLGNQAKQLKLLLEDRERETLEAVQSQARMVAAWYEWYRAGRGGYDSVRVRNASDLPVHDVVVLLAAPLETAGDDLSLKNHGVELIGTVPPAGEPIVVRTSLDYAPEIRSRLSATGILFRDSSGTCWERSAADGVLVQLSRGMFDSKRRELLAERSALGIQELR